ncbi:MAG TPA: periplasmic heavy metal sensor [Bryobacteraceae bacterium]|nr:periplasmic heavy metal sensor [Bryobacteraceae bacterium]HPT28129.1 periplasmic heavy metal sensor [Bryobacteraceae bacterium]
MRKLILICGLLAVPLLAQPPRGAFNWWESPLTRDVNLSEDQRVKIRDAIREFRPKLIDLRASMEKAEIETEEALNDDSFDQKRATDSIERLATVRGDMTRMMSQMSIRLRSILTAEQWKELQKKRQTMVRQNPGMGGMPGMRQAPGQYPMQQRRMGQQPMGQPGPGQVPPPDQNDEKDEE